MQDRSSWLERMREEAPVSREGRHGPWHVFRYADVKEVLTDHARFSSQRGRGGGSNNPQQALADSLISLDPPRHRHLRALVEKAFTPRRVEALAPRIEQLARELLDGFGSDGVELIREYAAPLPVTVIAEILGIPVADRLDFKRWSDATITGDPSGTREMAAYFTRLMARRREHPGGADLISALMQAEVDGQQLSGQELLGFCMLLLVAGNETTTNLIGNAVQVLTRHPEAQQALVEEPGLWPGAVEEVLRYRSPVQTLYRVATRDTRLGGERVREGEWVVSWIGAANHDPRQFADPQRFEPRRGPNRHLSFGHAVHFCLGAPLARLEARLALRALYGRHPHLRVPEGVSLRPIPSSIVQGVRELPVELGARA